jgi:hypothetical protein
MLLHSNAFALAGVFITRPNVAIGAGCGYHTPFFSGIHGGNDEVFSAGFAAALTLLIPGLPGIAAEILTA